MLHAACFRIPADVDLSEMASSGWADLPVLRKTKTFSGRPFEVRVLLLLVRCGARLA